MTGRQHSSLGDLVALRTQDPDSVEDLAAAVVRAPDPSSSPAADLSNVIPFARARRTGAESSMPPVTIRADDRPAAPPPAAGARRQFALVACSIAIHSVLFYAFWQQPKELASIGIEAITVEIMVGDNRPAGVAPSPGENEAVPVPSPEVKAEDKPVEQEQQQVAEAREVTPEEKQPETAKEQPPEDRPDIAMVETRTPRRRRRCRARLPPRCRR